MIAFDATQQPAPVSSVRPLPRVLIRTDFVLVMLLKAVRDYPAVRDAAYFLGRSLFPEGAVQVLATALVTGRPLECRHLPLSELERLYDLRIEVCECTVPDNEAWGLRLVRVQAENRHKYLLAEMLRWGADEVVLGHPLEHLQRRIDLAFAIAGGTSPMDSYEVWEVTS